MICEVSGFSWYVLYVFLRGIVGEMSGFSWYVFYVFLRRIVGEDKGIRTNGFRCHPKTIEVLPKNWVRGTPRKTPATNRSLGCPSLGEGTSRRILLLGHFIYGFS